MAWMMQRNQRLVAVLPWSGFFCSHTCIKSFKNITLNFWSYLPLLKYLTGHWNKKLDAKKKHFVTVFFLLEEFNLLLIKPVLEYNNLCGWDCHRLSNMKRNISSCKILTHSPFKSNKWQILQLIIFKKKWWKTLFLHVSSYTFMNLFW